MSLFKKTLVLSAQGVKGYVTIVRIGGSAGLKVVLAEPPVQPAYLALKISNMDILVTKLADTVTETAIISEVDERSSVGCALIENGRATAFGGKKEAVDLRHALALAASFDAPPVVQKPMPPVEAPPEPPAVDMPAPFAEPLEKPAVSPTRAKQFVPPDADAVFAQNAARNFDFLKNRKPNYYVSVQERVEEILRIYPTEHALNAIIPDSEWVMVHYDKDDFYVFGVLRESGKVTHIGYGLPGFEGTPPPKEAAEISDFVALPNPPQKGLGYWLMFQNAHDGQLVK